MQPRYTHEATYRSPNEPAPEVPTLPVQLAYVAVLPALVWLVANPVAIPAVTALVVLAVLVRRVGAPDWLPRPVRASD